MAGTLSRILARRGHKVVAFDTDPMPGLAISLGLGPVTDAMLQDAVQQDAEGRWRLRKGIGPARAIRRYGMVAPDGVRLIQFGKADRDGLAPVMASLNGLYQVLHRLGPEHVLRDWTVIGDLPAGPRQAAFDWAPYARTMIVVVEPSWQSALTARRIGRISRSRSGLGVALVANKVTASRDVGLIAHMVGEPVLAAVPSDEAVAVADRLGVAAIDQDPSSPFVRAVEELAVLLARGAQGAPSR
jgi:CO dehydrogenase maturation factor